MDISVIMPLYKPDKKILRKVLDSLKKQKFKGKKEIIKVDEGWGLAKSMNYGIKKAKCDIIITLHQDCIPSDEDWLNNLIKPLENKEVVATCSDIYDIENKKRYTPLLDEKGCAYKKEALERVGFFDDKTFLNSGEDMDMYMKLKRIGRISYPRCVVKHYHPGFLIKKAPYKKLQNANTWGCLFRRYGFQVPGVWKSLIKANVFNIKYFYWFWRGFFKKRQDFKR